MTTPRERTPDDLELVFAAHNNHVQQCGRPPRLRNTDSRGLYYGYFENGHSEQFVFTFDRATGTGTVSGGDLGWNEPKSFTVGLLDEVLRETRTIVEEGDAAASALPVIDRAMALGRFTGLTGQEEIIWLRACLKACAPIEDSPGGSQAR